MGTAGYLSPEQATGQAATAASDLNALGVVAQAMAKQPTLGPTVASVFGHQLLSLGEALATSELDADGSSWCRLQQLTTS